MTDITTTQEPLVHFETQYSIKVPARSFTKTLKFCFRAIEDMLFLGDTVDENLLQIMIKDAFIDFSPTPKVSYFEILRTSEKDKFKWAIYDEDFNNALSGGYWSKKELLNRIVTGSEIEVINCPHAILSYKFH